MAWCLLVGAGLLEIVLAYAMKQSHGFTRPLESIIAVVTMLGSVGLLTLAMRTLPMGTAYIMWTGIGVVGAFLVGIVFLQEEATLARLLAAALIIGGLITMKLSDPS